MTWQDLIISSANLVFLGSLSFQVYHGFKNKVCSITLSTSLLTFIGLMSMVTAFVSLSLYFSATISSLVALLWLTMFFQRFIF